MEDFYYRKLKVYHQAKEIVVDIYNLSKHFPPQESYGLTNQIQRAAVSIPSNIAEGMGRFSIKERLHFIEISYGSLMEVMCQLEIAETLNYITNEDLATEEKKITEVAKMLIGLRRNLEDKMTTRNV
jgi:four helix bundle protein